MILTGRPVIFGEVLFDHFDDGTRVLGGAAFNVAWHLHGFGMNPLLISRVGQDTPGEEVIASMHEWGMDTRGIQIDPMHPTGSVQVRITHGEPTFEIMTEQAFDYVNYILAATIIAREELSFLYNGTLTSRNPAGRKSLKSIRKQNSGTPIFVDLNLRTPWWDDELVDFTLQGTRWVKMNHDELGKIMKSDCDNTTTTEFSARDLAKRYALEMLIVTRGEQGACLIMDDNGLQCYEPEKSPCVVDVVGAGDAFTATTLLGLTRGWPQEITMTQSNEFAATICGQRGSVAQDRDMYRHFATKWGL